MHHMDTTKMHREQKLVRAVLHRSCKQQPTKEQSYGHKPTISQTNQVEQTRHCKSPLFLKYVLSLSVIVR